MAATDTLKELEGMAEEQVEALELQIIKHPVFALGVSPPAPCLAVTHPPTHPSPPPPPPPPPCKHALHRLR